MDSGLATSSCPGMTTTSSARQRDFLVGIADTIIVGRGDARADVGGRTWAAEAIALHRMDAGGAQEQMLLGVLHALRGDAHAETATEADDRVHNGGGVRRGFDAAHEARIDLELSNGKRRRYRRLE